MLAEAAELVEPNRDIVAVLTAHLRDGDAVVRAAAARALGALARSEAASALAGALMDEDPDVRTDAMSALVTCAREAERPSILASLCGDPVPEVKVAAVQALGRLGGPEAVALLTQLARERSEDEITWDDTESVWDDWLDVQTAAIAALGRLQVTEAIPVLMAAREDEFGQDLDAPVFSAFAAMGPAGVAKLVEQVSSPSARVRARAIAALREAAPEVLQPLAETLAEDPAPEIRMAGLGALSADSRLVERLMLSDPDPSIRSSAVRLHAAARTDLIAEALKDESDSVVSAALGEILERRVPTDIPDLKENLETWARFSSDALAGPSLKLLCRMAPERAAPILVDLSQDTAHGVADRVTSIGLIPEVNAQDPKTLAPLPDLLLAPERQVRLAALAAIVALCDAADPGTRDAAASVLRAAIAGEVDCVATAPSDAPPSVDAAAPKGEALDSRRVTISPDGEIVREDETEADNVIPVAFPQSTLDAIQQPAGSEPGEGAATARRRKRVPVTGPDDFAEDLRINALNVLGNVANAGIDAAVAEALAEPSDSLRAAALRALGRRGVAKDPAMAERISGQLASAEPAIRLAAAEALSAVPEARHRLSGLETDPDANVRACAVSALTASSADIGIAALSDRSHIVRQEAARALLQASRASVKHVAHILLRNGFTQTLNAIGRNDPAVHRAVRDIVSEVSGDPRALLCALEFITTCPPAPDSN